MPDFEQIYGMTWKEMDDDKRMMAILGVFHDVAQELKAINKRLDETNGKIKCVSRHEVYFKIIGITSGITVTGLVGYLIRMAFGA